MLLFYRTCNDREHHLNANKRVDDFSSVDYRNGNVQTTVSRMKRLHSFLATLVRGSSAKSLHTRNRKRTAILGVYRFPD